VAVNRYVNSQSSHLDVGYCGRILGFDGRESFRGEELVNVVAEAIVGSVERRTNPEVAPATLQIHLPY
jgi:hypothetical protein